MRTTMISYEEFEDIVVNTLKRNISSNEDQKKAISSHANESLFIVAGPGSGKTTVIVLKILKYIFVDDIAPDEILATTFTRKAANELHSRILSWGDQIKNYLLDNIVEDDPVKEMELMDFIEKKIDLNKINIGTTDSVAEDLLRIHREPGTNQPLVIEDFVTKSAMTNILLKDNIYLNENLKEYLKSFTPKEKLEEPSKMAEIILNMKNRMYYDQVNFDEIYDKFEEGSGAKLTLNCIKDYEDELKKRNIIDFPMLEFKFLNKLKNHKLDIFLDNIKIILIDEYQDTNLIQEDIYFTIAEYGLKNNGSITVVGDDDQSLYRFRGATVDLFTNFKKRAHDRLGINVEEINLKTNYRSSENIINHCNHFVELDKEYQKARVDEKPKIIAPYFDKDKMPVLGMFRNNPQMLARDLTLLINNLINNGEASLKIRRILNKDYYDTLNGNSNLQSINKQKQNNAKKSKNLEKITLKLDEEYGSASDIAILSYSPKEMKGSNPTFNFYLRKNLKKLKKPIEVFNPKGRDLQDVKQVEIFCGLILECIDPHGIIQKSDKQIQNLADRNMNRWRYRAIDHIKSKPEPNEPVSLSEFVISWQNRHPKNRDKWPESASLMELAYKLITWIEELQDDVEGIVYLEAITRSIKQTGFFNKYSGNIVFTNSKTERESVLEAIWNIFIPIATGGVGIDEDLLETLPDDRINIMSIHQSKGLEFPLVIVDVGSRFKKNTVNTQNLRFPKLEPKNRSIEDSVRCFSSLGESERSEKDRSFDDLTRLYFVAFSRAENVLLLIGLLPSLDGYAVNNNLKQIPNVALGWNRDEQLVGFDEIYLI